MSDETYSSEEQDLLKTRDVRFKIIDHLLTDGKPPDDENKLRLLLTTLADSDRTTLSKMKIKSEDKAAAGQAGAASIVAMFLNKVKLPVTQIFDIVPPSLPDSVPKPDIVEGETQIGCSNTNYKEFSERHYPTL